MAKREEVRKRNDECFFVNVIKLILGYCTRNLINQLTEFGTHYCIAVIIILIVFNHTLQTRLCFSLLSHCGILDQQLNNLAQHCHFWQTRASEKQITTKISWKVRDQNNMDNTIYSTWDERKYTTNNPVVSQLCPYPTVA